MPKTQLSWVPTVLLHIGGFCNGCVTKWISHL